MCRAIPALKSPVTSLITTFATLDKQDAKF
jgi:hypothetical protein